MEVHLRVPAALRELGGGGPTESLVVGHHATVTDLLDALDAVHPALARRIRDEQGRLRPHVNLFVGADNIRSLAGADTVLQPGDEVSILPAISGG